MKIYLIIIFLLLSGCGTHQANDNLRFSDEYKDKLVMSFYEVKDCVDVFLGEYVELSLELMPGQFICLDNKICFGSFTTPNMILFTSFRTYKHEVVHYLLYVNFNDLDKNHDSELFLKCSGLPN